MGDAKPYTIAQWNALGSGTTHARYEALRLNSAREIGSLRKMRRVCDTTIKELMEERDAATARAEKAEGNLAWERAVRDAYIPYQERAILAERDLADLAAENKRLVGLAGYPAWVQREKDLAEAVGVLGEAGPAVKATAWCRDSERPERSLLSRKSLDAANERAEKAEVILRGATDAAFKEKARAERAEQDLKDAVGALKQAVAPQDVGGGPECVVSLWRQAAIDRDRCAAGARESGAALADAIGMLKECGESLRHSSTIPPADPIYDHGVEQLGAGIGYGAIMSAASRLWRLSLKRSGYPAGGEFTTGPCRAVAESMCRRIDAIIKKHSGGVAAINDPTPQRCEPECSYYGGCNSNRCPRHSPTPQRGECGSCGGDKVVDEHQGGHPIIMEDQPCPDCTTNDSNNAPNRRGED